MPLSSSPITERYIIRSDTEPGRAIDGMLWINPTGGQNGNNSERYIYDGNADTWELTNSVGPDTPLYAASGAFWRDTANSTVKQYTGSSWANVGVTDHTNLTNVQSGQHHSKPTITQYEEKVGGYTDSVGTTAIDISLGGSHTFTHSHSGNHGDAIRVDVKETSGNDEVRLTQVRFYDGNSWSEVSNTNETISAGTTGSFTYLIRMELVERVEFTVADDSTGGSDGSGSCDVTTWVHVPAMANHRHNI